MNANLNIEKTINRLVLGTCLLVLVLASTSCYDEDALNAPVVDDDNNNPTALDNYIQSNFINKYGIAIRYKYVDKFVDPGKRVTPPKLEIVRPMLDFIDEYWINPYLEVPGGGAFFRRFVPAELVFLGGLIHNGDGSVTLGIADAGARITFTDVNSFDLSDSVWLEQQLHTTYHEFAHIVHQNYKLPIAFEDITPKGYSSAGSWFNVSVQEALFRGFVSPYATSSPNEDYAETVAFYLFDDNFFEKFTIPESGCITADCEKKNTGREFILTKINSIREHYQKLTGVDLDEVRTAVQSRLK